MSVIHTVHQAHSFYEQFHAARHFKHTYQQFVAIPNLQTFWNFGGNIVGVIGTERVIGALVKYGVKLALKAHSSDREAGREMVELMKSRVPVDTGTLLNGIQMEDDGETIRVTASAVRDGDVDYARFVEFGRSGGSAVADNEFFENGANAGSALHGSGGKGSVPPHPYFLNSTREVLQRRQQELSKVMSQTASEEGF